MMPVTTNNRWWIYVLIKVEFSTSPLGFRGGGRRRRSAEVWYFLSVAIIRNVKLRVQKQWREVFTNCHFRMCTLYLICTFSVFDYDRAFSVFLLKTAFYLFLTDNNWMTAMFADDTAILPTSINRQTATRLIIYKSQSTTSLTERDVGKYKSVKSRCTYILLCVKLWISECCWITQ